MAYAHISHTIRVKVVFGFLLSRLFTAAAGNKTRARIAHTHIIGNNSLPQNRAQIYTRIERCGKDAHNYPVVEHTHTHKNTYTHEEVRNESHTEITYAYLYVISVCARAHMCVRTMGDCLAYVQIRV